MSERQPFPPCRNPWQYFPAQGEPDLQFRMFSTLLSMVLLGAYTGWLVVRPVPLLPNWLGALGAAGAVGYATTLPDGTGDLLRYLGYAAAHAAGVLLDTAEEVQVSFFFISVVVVVLSDRSAMAQRPKTTYAALCGLLRILLSSEGLLFVIYTAARQGGRPPGPRGGAVPAGRQRVQGGAAGALSAGGCGDMVDDAGRQVRSSRHALLSSVPQGGGETHPHASCLG